VPRTDQPKFDDIKLLETSDSLQRLDNMSDSALGRTMLFILSDVELVHIRMGLQIRIK
jgi:hypothetical protein